MRIWIPLRCVAIVLALGAGMLGLTATDAFAVAGKPVTVNVGQEMANATLVFDMKEGPDVEVVVSPQGEATLPANVNKDTVADCYKKEKTATGETKEKVNCAAWLPAGGAGAAAAAGGVRPLGDMLQGTIIRFNGFAGGISPNDYRDVQGQNIISGFNFGNINANAGPTLGAGVQVVLPGGWTGEVRYQYFSNNFPGQTIKETPGGLRDIAGGHVQTNAAVFMFGYEWDCWKNIRVNLGAGPIIGTTKLSTAGSERSTQAYGLNAEANIRYYVTRKVSVFGGYQYYQLNNTSFQNIDVAGAGRRDFNLTQSGNIGRIGVSYDF